MVRTIILCGQQLSARVVPLSLRNGMIGWHESSLNPRHVILPRAAAVRGTHPASRQSLVLHRLPRRIRGRAKKDRSMDPHLHRLPIALARRSELTSRLGTDQIIWCYTQKADFRETSRQMVEWALRVPTQKILTFYDSVVWARIIGKTPCTLPEEQRRRIRAEALDRFPNDPQRRHEFEDTRTAEIWNEPSPDGGWWSKLFVDRSDRNGTDALISHPIDRTWLLSKTLRGL